MKNLKAWIKRCKNAEKKGLLDSSLSLAYREANLLERKLKFAELIIKSCSEFDIRNCDVTNSYWMERRRLDALHKRKMS